MLKCPLLRHFQWICFYVKCTYVVRFLDVLLSRRLHRHPKLNFIGSLSLVFIIPIYIHGCWFFFFVCLFFYSFFFFFFYNVCSLGCCSVAWRLVNVRLRLRMLSIMQLREECLSLVFFWEREALGEEGARERPRNQGWSIEGIISRFQGALKEGGF